MSKRDSFQEFTHLPLGVSIVKHFELLDVTMMECSHATEYRRNRRGFGAEMCSVCKATDFRRPVKVFGHVPAEVSLF